MHKTAGQQLHRPRFCCSWGIRIRHVPICPRANVEFPGFVHTNLPGSIIAGPLLWHSHYWSAPSPHKCPVPDDKLCGHVFISVHTGGISPMGPHLLVFRGSKLQGSLMASSNPPSKSVNFSNFHKGVGTESFPKSIRTVVAGSDQGGDFPAWVSVKAFRSSRPFDPLAAVTVLQTFPAAPDWTTVSEPSIRAMFQLYSRSLRSQHLSFNLIPQTSTEHMV